MSLIRQAQANPEEPFDLELSELQASVQNTVKVLEANSPAISRWFWKAFFALNCVLGSLALWFIVLPALLH